MEPNCLLSLLFEWGPTALVCLLVVLVVVIILGVRYDRQQQIKIWDVKNEVKLYTGCLINPTLL